MVTPSFLTIGGSTTRLQDLSPNGLTTPTESEVYVQTLNAYGVTVNQYDWINYGDDPDFPAGWYDEELNLLTDDVVFAPGTGLWTSAPSEDVSLTSSGKVPKTDVSVTLQNGGTSTGNMMPIEIDINDIVVSGYTGTTESDVCIQILNAYGQMVTQYDWIDYGDDPDFPAGWYDSELNLIETGTVKFAPGEGFYVLGTSGAFSIRIPAPEL